MPVCARVRQNKIIFLFLLFIVELVPELNKEVATVHLSATFLQTNEKNKAVHNWTDQQCQDSYCFVNF